MSQWPFQHLKSKPTESEQWEADLLEVLDAKAYIGSSPCPAPRGRLPLRSQMDLFSFVDKKRSEPEDSVTGNVSVPLQERLGCRPSAERLEQQFMENLAAPLPQARMSGKKTLQSKVDQRDFWGGSFKE